MNRQFENILTHSLVNIGDVVLATSALVLLRQAYPKAKITMMVRANVAELLQNHPIIDEVLVYDYKGKQRSLGQQLRFLQELRRRRFDLVISFDRKLRPALLSWLAGIPVRVVPEKVFDDVPSKAVGLYTDIIPITYDVVNHLQADTYQEIVRRFCGVNGQASPVIGQLTPAHQEKAAALLARFPAGKKKVALCVKGTYALKNWPLERFAALVGKLSRVMDAVFYVIGAPGDRDYAAGLEKCTGVPVANLCGETSLMELKALFEQTDLLITVDTGATHIAATTGIPMVVLYGCTSPARWAPYNPNAVTISREPQCCPCSKGEDECDQGQCLLNVSVDEVYRQVMQLVKAQKQEDTDTHQR